MADPSCPVQPERDVRVRRAQRGQITWGRVDLDAEVPADHEVRAIAAVVDKLDLRGLYADVRARGEIAGAPATAPKTLLGLWVYATSGDQAKPGGSDSDGVRGSGTAQRGNPRNRNEASARVARSRGSSSSTPPTAGCAAASRSPITASTTSAAITVTCSASS
jgi:hypothetical protein